MRFLAFDLETARLLPENGERSAHPQLGISCYALAWRTEGNNTEGNNTEENNKERYEDEIATRHGFGIDNAGAPQSQMSRAECSALVDELTAYVQQGFTLLTWNGLGFDFDILAQESGRHAACCELALAHVDMMFHFFCLQGYALGLDRAAKGMGLAGKLAGMDGSQAPRLWQQGQYDQVLAYVTQDVITTLTLAEEVAKRGQIRWHTRRSKANRASIPAWLPVHEAIKLPLPSAKWLRRPMTRERFTAWMERSA